MKVNRPEAININDSSSLNIAPLKSEIKATLGRYQLLNEVGRGSNALVYRAYDPQLERFLAIKVLKNHLAKNKDYRNSFIYEARLAAKLSHPNIVTIYDVGISNEKPYIAMELLDGVTLEELLNNSQIPLKNIIHITSQLLKGLHYAHSQGLIHRDIKPANILFVRDKKNIKLTDFGIAKMEESTDKKAYLSDKVLGTPEYMSPEQVLGKSMDVRSDLYSTGVLIYRMIYGVTPFNSNDLGQLFKKIVKNKPPELQISDGLVSAELVSDELKDLLRKLLQKKASKRYQSAALLMTDLQVIAEKLLEHNKEPIKVVKSLSTRWTALMAGAVFISMCVGLAVVYFMQYKTLSSITYDYGYTVGKMIAYQSSEAIILNDSIALNTLVSETAKNEQLNEINIINNSNMIIASSNKDNVGMKLQPVNNITLVKTVSLTKIYRRNLSSKEMLFDVSMPVYFGDKKVGGLYLSFSSKTIVHASNATLITMIIIMLITLIVVFIATFILAKQTSNDYRRVTDGLNKMSTGRIDARIISDKGDEAGQMYAAFNRLAAYLERRFENKK